MGGNQGKQWSRLFREGRKGSCYDIRERRMLLKGPGGEEKKTALSRLVKKKRCETMGDVWGSGKKKGPKRFRERHAKINKTTQK